MVVLLLASGCSGGDGKERAFTAADADRIASTQPVTPGWPAWPETPTLSREPDGSEVGNKWEDDDKLANLVVQVFPSAGEAHEWLPKFNRLTRKWTENPGFIVAKDEEVSDLGDEAWVLWVGGNGTQVTYHWRRGNLVVEAHVHCYGDCPSDVDSAARAWADAIDEEARQES